MRLTIYRKMMIGFTIIIVLMIVASTYVMVELRSVAETTRSTLTIDVQAIDLAKQLRTILYEEERYAQRYLIAHDSTYRAVFVENNHSFVRLLDSLSGMLTTPRDHQIILEVGELHDWHFAAVAGAAGSLDPIAGEKTRTEAVDTILRSLDELIAARQGVVSASVESIEATTRRSLRVASLIVFGTLIAAIGSAVVIARTITRPLHTLVAGTKEIAGGSFTRIRVRSHDEIADLARAFNSMSASLDALNRFRAEMMQHISHELRMPLQTMHSAYYLLTEEKAGPLTPPQLELLNAIRENIDKIAKFSNQFLDLSKVEAGMMEYNLVRLDLAPLLRQAVDEVHPTAVRRQITVSFVPSPCPEVFVDAEKCSQVFANLLSNALKYTDKDGTVEVTLGPCPKGACVRVRDTGTGIPATELPKIFTKFYRASTAVKGKRRGTGIGLAFVKAVVDGQGGNVSVTRTVGTGSTFIVEFPSADPPERKNRT